jgi:hypothetical protein
MEDPERSAGLRPGTAGLKGSAAHPATEGKVTNNRIAPHGARWPQQVDGTACGASSPLRRWKHFRIRGEADVQTRQACPGGRRGAAR